MTQRSHITQVMQNYFDATDRRTRENSAALEAQLLNMAAVTLEDLNLRVTRETSQTLQTIPVGIDNGGVYYSGRVPEQFLTGPDQTSFTSVVAKKGSNLTTLSVYDDKLPVPSRLEVTSDPVGLTNPILFTVTGTGDEQSQLFTVQHVFLGSFPIPNKLTLWLDQLGLNLVDVILTITGETAPQPAWISERKKTTEVVEITSEGVAYSRNRWALIDKIDIRNLPVGVRVRGWSIPFGLPACPDPVRPYTTPEDRDVLYPRYWQISNSDSLLYEMYRAGGFSGLEPVNSYSVVDILSGVAIEPFTNGMYIATANKIYYADRREYQPDLTQTGLQTEPLYGLQVSIDISKTGPTRYVALSAIPFANANSIFQYRYTVNGTNSILPNGALGPLNAGWRGGAPQPVSFAMLASGDYQFRLEMQDGNGITTFDVVPYRNASLVPLKTIDISGLVDSIVGLCFDSYGQLWVWDGNFAIPIKIHYDGYVFDADTKTIFVTEQFDSLQIS